MKRSSVERYVEARQLLREWNNEGKANWKLVGAWIDRGTGKKNSVSIKTWGPGMTREREEMIANLCDKVIVTHYGGVRYRFYNIPRDTRWEELKIAIMKGEL